MKRWLSAFASSEVLAIGGGKGKSNGKSQEVDDLEVHGTLFS